MNSMPLWRTAVFESEDNTSTHWNATQRLEITSPCTGEDGIVRLTAFQGDDIDPNKYVVGVTLSREDLRDFIEELERYTR